MNSVKKLLLVEDDLRIGIALKIRLSAAGYDVLIADGVNKALVTITDAVPDIAVLDVNLPDGDGIELMQTIVQKAPNTSVVIMTASRLPGLREHAIDKGAVAFLEKPFPSSDLLNAIADR